MDYFTQACAVLQNQLGKDVAIALATCAGDKPSVRNVDGYYKDGSIYITSHEASYKMGQIAQNNRVAFCRAGDFVMPFYEGLLEGFGTAVNLGHPTEEKNKELREELRQVFSAFYDRHVDEADPKTCILEVKLTSAVVFDGAYKYTVDFTQKQAQRQELRID